MKPIKSARGIANWLLRISLSGLFIFISIPVVLKIDFDSAQFYISLIQLMCAIMLFLGGFFTKHTLTILAGMVLFLLGVYMIFTGWSSKIDTEFFMDLLIASTGFYFISNGNRN